MNGIEEIVLEEKIGNQEEKQIDFENNNNLLASAENYSFKNNNILWIGAIIIVLILGILAKKFKKL